MGQLDPETEAMMRKQAQAAKERQAGGNFIRSWAINGKNAIALPGQSATTRLLPRWNYAESVILDAATQKRVPNPNYVKGQRMYIYALEHWWDGQDGKTQREWCVRTKIEDSFTMCPICVAADKLSKSPAESDRKLAKRIQAKEVWVFNAVVGMPRRVDQAGRADIRTISLNGTLFWQVFNIMSPEDKQFARGDISDPRDGYDLSLNRPLAGGGDRWRVDCAPNQSALYQDDQKKAFAGWVTMLVDLDKMLEDERMDAAGLYQAYYGVEASSEDLEPEAPAAVPTRTPAIPAAQPQAAEPSSPPPTGPDDDDFMPPPAQAPAPAAATGPRPPARPATGRPGGGRR